MYIQNITETSKVRANEFKRISNESIPTEYEMS